MRSLGTCDLKIPSPTQKKWWGEMAKKILEKEKISEERREKLGEAITMTGKGGGGTRNKHDARIWGKKK